jgi:hypothetical protein
MTSLLRRARDRLELRRGARHERRLQDDFQRGLRRPELDRWFMDRHGPAVLHGPFAGLAYPAWAAGRAHHLVAKLLGAYEEELAAVIGAQVARRPPLFVDLGAADGYYAVGLGLASPGTAVHAYDIDPVARRALRALARANGVRVEVHGPANARRLAAHELAGAFVLCDLEGAEVDVLDGEALPALAAATVLVELHPLPAGAGDTEGVLRERFAGTHRARTIESRPRDPAAYRELDDAPPELREHAVDEIRGWPTRWLLLEPIGPEDRRGSEDRRAVT